jgi:hypothetical protein
MACKAPRRVLMRVPPLLKGTASPEQRRLESHAMRGHSLYTPDGRQILVDRDALAELQKAGVLNGRRNRIKPNVFPALVRGMLSDRVRNHLGGIHLTGPNVCICRCSQCRESEEGRN